MPRQPKDIVIPQQAGIDLEKLEFKRSEDEKEKALRLEKERLTFYFKELGTYVFGFLFLAVTAFYCFWALFDKSTSPEERRYVWAAVSAVMGGIVGIVFGRSTK
jgi:hypothetical protein